MEKQMTWGDYREYRETLAEILKGNENSKRYSDLITNIFLFLSFELDYISSQRKKIRTLVYYETSLQCFANYSVLSLLRKFGINTDKIIFITANIEENDPNLNKLLEEVLGYKNSMVFLFTIGYLRDSTEQWLKQKMIERESFIVPVSNGDMYDILDCLEYGDAWDFEELIVSKVVDLFYEVNLN